MATKLGDMCKELSDDACIALATLAAGEDPVYYSKGNLYDTFYPKLYTGMHGRSYALIDGNIFGRTYAEACRLFCHHTGIGYAAD